VLYIKFVKKSEMKRLLSLIFIITFLFSCRNHEAESKRIITTSISPFKYFVSAIAGDDFEVNVIVPPGASPATFEPTPSVMRALGNSDLLVLDGYLGYELAWAGQLKETNPGMKTLVLAESQDLIYGEAHQHGDHQHYSGVDPHFWVSPVAAQKMASEILEVLKETWPDEGEKFIANYIALEKEIEATGRYLDSLFTGLHQRSFMIFHPALTYLARDYNLEQVAVETEGKEPTPMGLKEFIDHGRSENIGVIFVQREFDKKNALTIASEIGATVVEIDPLSENWPESVRSIGRALKDGLIK